MTWTFARAARERLSRALRKRDPAELVSAAALTQPLLTCDDDRTVVARRAAGILEAILLDPSGPLPDAERIAVERALEEIDGHGDPAARLSSLWRELAALLEPAAPPSTDVTTAIQRYLADHLAEGVTLRDLARALGYSPSHVSMLVRRATGQRFTALRRTIQLERAAMLLTRGTSVKEAALGAGFTDPAYFSRVFQRRHGVPPSRWRAKPLALLLALLMTAACRRPAPPVPTSGDCVAPATWAIPATGRTSTTPDVLARAARGRIVLLGELHDRADHHRWQAEVIAGLLARRDAVVVGFEMFPRRVQPALDLWTADRLDEANFLTATDWDAVWGFDPALYMPLFHLARMNRLPMVALNVDRALVARIGRDGWDAVPAAEREGVGRPAPADPAYRAGLETVFAAHGQKGDAPDVERFIEAQLTWDRAIAEGLATAAQAHPGALVVGVMGMGHLEHGYGVPHQLAALGIRPRDVTVLLPWDTNRDCADRVPGLADAVFGITPAEHAPEPPRLGVLLRPADGGVEVIDVTPDAPGAKAGLRKGDVIVAAAGTKVTSAGAMRAIVGRVAPGTWLPLTVRRHGRSRELIARFGPAS
jgi:uncharacterized iron-regulated protein/AraC-like DNA-binding protein